MDLDARLRIVIDKRTNATGLVARKKLADDAAGRENDGIRVVDVGLRHERLQFLKADQSEQA
jgi:hypothetical protein